MMQTIFRWWNDRRFRFPRRLMLLAFASFASVLLLTGLIATATVPPSSDSLTIPALLDQAKATYQNGQFQASQQLWQQLAQRFADQGDRLNQAMALSNLSLTAQQVGDWETASTAIAESQTLLQAESPQTSGQQKLLARSLEIQGQLSFSRGEADRALQSWQTAQTLYQAIGNAQEVATNQINQALAYQELGMYSRACQTLLTVLHLPDQTCQLVPSQLENLPSLLSSSSQVLALQNLGNTLRLVGKTEASFQALFKAQQLSVQQPSQTNPVEISLALGNTARAIANQKLRERERRLAINLGSGVDCLADPTKGNSIKFYGQAASCYHQVINNSPNTLLKLQAQLNLLSLGLQLQYWPDLPVLIPQVEKQLSHLPPSRTSLIARLKLAQNLMCLQWIANPSHRPILPPPILQSCPQVAPNSPLERSTVKDYAQIDQLQNLVQTGLTQSRSLGDTLLEANALGYLGAIAYMQGNLPEALQFTEKARLQVSTYRHPEVAYLWQWQLGRILQRQAQLTPAIAAYNNAYNLLQSLRQELVTSSPDLQFAFRDRVEPVYRELVDLLLQSSLPSQEKLKQSRDVIESLQLAELNNFFQEACLEGTSQKVDQIDPKAAIVYAITLPQRLAVILSIAGQPLQVFETPLSKLAGESSIIDPVVQSLMQNTLNPTSNQLDLQPNQQLYNWLIRPLEQTLKTHGIETLVFVLDGVLRGIPVATLHDGQQFLIEKYDLALVPGLQLLISSPSRFSSESFTDSNKNALIGALVEARQGFNALPGVAAEVKAISDLIPSEVMINEDFTSSHLQSALKQSPFPIVHLATHGQFSSKAEDTFLLTWNERINVKNLDQLLRETEQQSRPIELLILSACQTATGDNRAPLGLAGVAVRSGAKSTLATLWPVYDKSTAQLMTTFYLGLNQSGTSKAEALRQAQLSLLRDPNFHHPYYWAPFVLIGNWL